MNMRSESEPNTRVCNKWCRGTPPRVAARPHAPGAVAESALLSALQWCEGLCPGGSVPQERVRNLSPLTQRRVFTRRRLIKTLYEPQPRAEEAGAVPISALRPPPGRGSPAEQEVQRGLGARPARRSSAWAAPEAWHGSARLPPCCCWAPCWGRGPP